MRIAAVVTQLIMLFNNFMRMWVTRYQWMTDSVTAVSRGCQKEIMRKNCKLMLISTSTH